MREVRLNKYCRPGRIDWIGKPFQGWKSSSGLPLVSMNVIRFMLPLVAYVLWISNGILLRSFLRERNHHRGGAFIPLAPCGGL